jgi:hypothetical protein
MCLYQVDILLQEISPDRRDKICFIARLILGAFPAPIKLFLNHTLLDRAIDGTPIATGPAGGRTVLGADEIENGAKDLKVTGGARPFYMAVRTLAFDVYIACEIGSIDFFCQLAGQTGGVAFVFDAVSTVKAAQCNTLIDFCIHGIVSTSFYIFLVHTMSHVASGAPATSRLQNPF